MSYEEFIDLAMTNYEKGGDSFVECWEQTEFDEYVSTHGSITKAKARKMFKFELMMQREIAGWC